MCMDARTCVSAVYALTCSNDKGTMRLAGRLHKQIVYTGLGRQPVPGTEESLIIHTHTHTCTAVLIGDRRHALPADTDTHTQTPTSVDYDSIQLYLPAIAVANINSRMLVSAIPGASSRCPEAVRLRSRLSGFLHTWFITTCAIGRTERRSSEPRIRCVEWKAPGSGCCV